MAYRIQLIRLVACLLVVCPLVVCLSPVSGLSVAVAQKPGDQTVAADALFKEGLSLMQAGDYVRACERFAASHRFEPSIGALLNLGNCREKLGQLATAHELFAQAAGEARASGDEKRARYAEERMKKLEPRLSFLMLEVGPKARIQGLEILRNDTVVPPSAWNQRMAVDPGTSIIRARAPLCTAFETRVEVKAGADHAAVIIPVLECEEQGTAARPPATPHSARRPGSGTMDRDTRPASPSSAGLPGSLQPGDERSGMSMRNKLALGSAGAGAVGLMGSLILGWQARSQFHAARALCDNDRVASCTEVERQLSQEGRDQARLTGNIATVSFAVGATALATGVILWLTKPDARRPGDARRDRATRVEPVLQPGGAVVKVHVRF